MAAPKGNRFWELRSSHGPNPRFEHANDLWDACCEYFEWVQDNPLLEAKTVTVGGKLKTVDLPKMRAMTLTGLCVFLDIADTTWADWRKNRKDLSGIITRVEAIIRTQKFEGAAADLLNANIIAREIGLAERTKHTVDANVTDRSWRALAHKET